MNGEEDLTGKTSINVWTSKTRKLTVEFTEEKPFRRDSWERYVETREVRSVVLDITYTVEIETQTKDYSRPWNKRTRDETGNVGLRRDQVSYTSYS